MAGNRIQRLDVEGFRGVLQPRSFLFEGKSLVLFGESGSGKSTFVDALERLFTGKVSTLDGRAQGLSSQRHGPHIKLNPPLPRIAVTFNGASATTVDLDTPVESLPGRVQSYLKAAHEPVYILRRGQILAFIESSPRDRYQLLRPFLPLSSVEVTEKSLGEARKRLEDEAERRRREAAGRREDLARLLGLTPGGDDLSETNVLRTLGDRLEAAGRPRLDRLSHVPQAIADLNNVLSKFGDLAKPTALMAAITALEELKNAMSTLDAETALASLAALREREAREARIFYEKVLEEGSRWIEEENRIECPLCQQEMRRFPPAEVVRRARARLDEMRELLGLRETASRGMETLRQQVLSCIEAAERAQARLLKLAEEERGDAESTMREAIQSLAGLSAIVRRPPTTVNPTQVRSAATPLRADGPFVRKIDQSVEALRQRLVSLPSTQAAQSLLALRALLQRFEASWGELTRSQVALEESQTLAKTARIAEEAMQEARKEAVGRIFDEISDDVDRIYSELHRHHELEKAGEPSHHNVRLEIREAVQQSVNLRADFYDRSEIDPRAYYSDAHLDTLGISIFLALRRWYRKQHSEFDLMVLDDVLTSVDTGHSVRMSEVLLEEFRDYQILLTTHDRIWFDYLRDIQARCGVAQNFVNRVIYEWTIEEGPDLREPEEENDRLEQLLANGQPYEIAGLAGRLLEHVLQEMRYALRLRVPAKPGELYEIGDLWPPFYKEVRKDYPGLYSAGQATFDALDVRWPLRNWGAHFKPLAKNVSRSTVVDFGRAVRDLFGLLFCQDCRWFVAPSATPLGQIGCRCGNKMYPAPGKRAVRSMSREALVSATDGALRHARLGTVLHLEWKRVEQGRQR